MKIKKIEEFSLEKYFENVKMIGNLLLNSLNNQLMFKQKLQVLEITINKSRNEKTDAFLMRKNEEFELLIIINPNDSIIKINFIIAHEMAHLLFSICNKLRISGYCSTDDSFDFTSVRRICNGEEYGNALEEMLCDYIALELLHKYYNDEYTRENLIDIVYSEERGVHVKDNFNLTLKLISLFGNTYSSKFDAVLENSNDCASPENLLLYTVVTGALNLLINEFDTLMGNGSWKRLNQKFEMLASKERDDAKKIIDIEMKRFSMM